MTSLACYLCVHVLQSVQNNGSLYIHTYFVRSGNSPDPSDGDTYSSVTTVYRSKSELLGMYVNVYANCREETIEICDTIIGYD